MVIVLVSYILAESCVHSYLSTRDMRYDPEGAGSIACYSRLIPAIPIAFLFDSLHLPSIIAVTFIVWGLIGSLFGWLYGRVKKHKKVPSLN